MKHRKKAIKRGVALLLWPLRALSKRWDYLEKHHPGKLTVCVLAIPFAALLLAIGGEECSMRAASERCGASPLASQCGGNAEAAIISRSGWVVCDCEEGLHTPWLLPP